MNAAIHAYETTGRTMVSGRVAEAMAFSKAARALEEARTHAEDRHRLREALRLNRMVWTTVQAEITEEGSHLPRRLKAGLMSLSLFVDKIMAELPARFDPDQIQILIDLNREMASGLIDARH